MYQSVDNDNTCILLCGYIKDKITILLFLFIPSDAVLSSDLKCRLYVGYSGNDSDSLLLLFCTPFACNVYEQQEG